ncbi:MAG: dihydrolipoamide acetyltransferase family protein [Thermoplasmatales archaeon]|nr:2-oxo acid dehydrogenase subunit E2 [Candidatus Thermoplasmatota archaeon]MCL6003073.1 2-oxo acid dehydrogenase subunit E2 [Candidatus Thermoplasmatota archaeon]MDA8054671.1 dihydrolipoamide acetyltransferase family protein [Thermoplasmatales archaeon]
MPTFKLPDIGEGVQEGEVVKWNVKQGDMVHKDDIIVEVMTDKVTVQIPSPFEGQVTKLYCKEGEITKVGSPLLDIGEPSVSASIEPAPRETTASEQIKEELTEKSSVLAPPGVRKLAREKGIDLSRVKGTGTGGRVTVKDVESFTAEPKEKIETAPVRSVAVERRVMELKGLRRLISEKMTKSKRNIPHYAVAEEIKMQEIMDFKEKLKNQGINLSYTPFFVKAAVAALKEYPYLNARSLEDGNFELLDYYNIGIAVDTVEGLTVAVVKQADKKSLTELSVEIEELAKRAREGKLKLDEVKDSTFTVTNVGSIGGIFSTPIINYPEVAIMGVHRIMDSPLGKYMYVTLSADHRLIDGAMAARFITRVKRYLEAPATLLV